MEIQKTLVLSTGHLPENEYDILTLVPITETNDLNCFRATQHQYGTILVLPDKETVKQNIKSTSKRYPTLVKIIEYCVENEIMYIDFDQDGDLYDEFEQFDW